MPSSTYRHTHTHTLVNMVHFNVCTVWPNLVAGCFYCACLLCISFTSTHTLRCILAKIMQINITMNIRQSDTTFCILTKNVLQLRPGNKICKGERTGLRDSLQTNLVQNYEIYLNKKKKML